MKTLKKFIIPLVVTGVLAYCLASLKINFIIAFAACFFMLGALSAGMLCLREPAEK